jgi:predicted DCC family thiol-disulfide oxidoreductase YuxK
MRDLTMDNQLTVSPLDMKTLDHVILFDGVCKLCNGWSRFVIYTDKKRRFKLATVQSDQGQEILRHFGLPTDHFDTMVYVESGKLYVKSSAFLKAISGFPLPYKLLAVFWIIPVPIRDWLYDLVAQNRYKIFGRYDQCMLPTADHLERFL